MPRLTSSALASLLPAVALLALLSTHGTAADLVVFGDSLSDSTGNYLKLSKGTYPDAKWYLGGRSAGGPMWPAYISTWTKLKLRNFAYLGANACPQPNGVIDEAGLLTSPDGFDQVRAYLSKTRRRDVRKNLHVLFLGANDYLEYLVRTGLKLIDPTKKKSPTPPEVVTCLAGIATRLLRRGARKLVISDIPPISISPLFARVPAEQQPIVKLATDAHNALVLQLVANLTKAYPKASIVFLPTSTAAVSTHTNYKKYGLINNSVPALVLDRPILTYPFIAPSALRRKSKKYYWFDNVHPTASVHKILSKIYLSVITKLL